jgi:hypothetical protein
MSDTKTQEQKDAAAIASAKKLMPKITQGQWKFRRFITPMDGTSEIDSLEAPDGIVLTADGDWKGKASWLTFENRNDQLFIELAPAIVAAALREIDRLRAKAAAYDTLRAACKDAPELLMMAAEYASDIADTEKSKVAAEDASTYRSKAAQLRTALTAPADGSADADADAADGSGVGR